MRFKHLMSKALQWRIGLSAFAMVAFAFFISMNTVFPKSDHANAVAFIGASLTGQTHEICASPQQPASALFIRVVATDVKWAASRLGIDLVTTQRHDAELWVSTWKTKIDAAGIYREALQARPKFLIQPVYALNGTIHRNLALRFYGDGVALASANFQSKTRIWMQGSTIAKSHSGAILYLGIHGNSIAKSSGIGYHLLA